MNVRVLVLVMFLLAMPCGCRVTVEMRGSMMTMFMYEGSFRE